MRLDKWIWAVRMVKTRTLGNELCRAGHVTVNGDKAKPSRELRLDDVVEIARGRWIKRYKAKRLIERRVSAKEAAECIDDLSPPPLSEEAYLASPVGERERGSGRPTKKDRRAIAKLSEKFF